MCGANVPGALLRRHLGAWFVLRVLPLAGIGAQFGVPSGSARGFVVCYRATRENESSRLLGKVDSPRAGLVFDGLAVTVRWADGNEVAQRSGLEVG